MSEAELPDLAGYHEGYGAALIEFIHAIVMMDSRGQDSDGQFLVGKGDLESVLRSMVSDRGIYQQALADQRKQSRADALNEAATAVRAQAEVWTHDSLVYVGIGIARAAINNLRQVTP